MTRLERDLAIVGKRWRCSSYFRSDCQHCPSPLRRRPARRRASAMTVRHGARPSTRQRAEAAAGDTEDMGTTSEHQICARGEYHGQTACKIQSRPPSPVFARYATTTLNPC
jgi:hypothetical protein